MTSSYFFSNFVKNEQTEKIIDYLEKYAVDKHLQVYLIDKPLGENKYTYGQKEIVVLLIPKSKIVFINLGEPIDAFEEFYEDFVEDLGIISDKYEYKKILGRPKEWKLQATNKVESFEFDQLEQILYDMQISDPKWQKNCDLLISLLTGSINDIDRVQDDVPRTLLDKIKQKIILYDGDQTRFIYNKSDSEMITIQGLSGTGKTELLLQKLKDLYIKDEKSKILFTCWNKVLSDSLKDRIPNFFNFMKVEQQIEWDSRLFCFHAWGSYANMYSGAYRYICGFYNIPFNMYSRSTTFDTFCIAALESIQNIKNSDEDKFEYAFDYSFIDESQDFPQSFFDLVKMVTSSTVYIAGDIFQDIFSRDNQMISEPDFLLSKCYRTDPRTLMFAHALGMGLFEENKLRWLDDSQWKACGYQFENKEGMYTLRREPLRRFEELDINGFESVKLLFGDSLTQDETIEIVLNQIQNIRLQNETVKPGDIAIIFIDSNNYVYSIADKMVARIEDKYGWPVNRAYETKQVLPNMILLSNSNNAKGLEFPFVICITSNIFDSYRYRNTLYTMLTRSFIQSILIITQPIDIELKGQLKSGLNKIYNDGCMCIKEPSEKERDEIKTKLEAHESQISLYDTFSEICEKTKISRIDTQKLFDSYIKLFNDDDPIDKVKITSWIKFNIEQMKSK
ncbi:MAG: ATP-binding domain-containing protein [Bacteroidales bacterium]|nr:ATP-binding domain-containing protein [Bacteroidales bacterium]